MEKSKTTKSPVIITLRANRLEVEDRESGELLAHCFIGDEPAVEWIADSLSAKRLGADAMKVREMVERARPRC